MRDNVPSRTQEIISDMKNYIDERGADYAEWYVGICADPYGSDFVTHKIRSLYWMYIETGSPQIARDVAIHFVTSLGTDGDVGDPVTANVSTIVYVCKKAAQVTGKTGINGDRGALKNPRDRNKTCDYERIMHL